jgi:hypothetical protein
MFRDITIDDLEPIAQDISTDPAHNQQPGVTPEVFLDPQAKNVAFTDDTGEVIFWASFSREVRVRIQFREGVDKDKVRAAFERYVPMFSDTFKAAGAKAFLFDSVSAPLIWFLRKFGFRKMNSEYRKEL